MYEAISTGRQAKWGLHEPCSMVTINTRLDSKRLPLAASERTYPSARFSKSAAPVEWVTSTRPERRRLGQSGSRYRYRDQDGGPVDDRGDHDPLCSTSLEPTPTPGHSCAQDSCRDPDCQSRAQLERFHDVLLSGNVPLRTGATVAAEAFDVVGPTPVAEGHNIATAIAPVDLVERRYQGPCSCNTDGAHHRM